MHRMLNEISDVIFEILKQKLKKKKIKWEEEQEKCRKVSSS